MKHKLNLLFLSLIFFNFVFISIISAETMNVECASNADCSGSQYCNTEIWECESTSIGPYCGDGNCDRDESEINCPQDCGGNIDTSNHNTNSSDNSTILISLIIAGAIIFTGIVVVVILKNRGTK